MTDEVTNSHERALAGESIQPLLTNRAFTIKDLTYSIWNGDAENQQNFHAGVKSVLDHVSEFTELTFTYAGTSGGNLRLTMQDEGGVNGGSGPNGNVGQAQVSRFGDQVDLSLEEGNAFVVMHEIGHAFGMAHPHRGDYSLPKFENSINASVMSYGSSRDDAMGGRVFYTEGVKPTGYAIYDIAHLQHLYGANKSFKAGSDVYELDADTPMGKTIWDGGGLDVFSTQTSQEDSVLDLRSGVGNISSVGTHHLWVAYGAEIENAFAGSGDDVINGSELANELRGNDGNDIIDGGAGADRIIGGADDDLLAGGQGADTFSFGVNDGNDVIASFDEAAISGTRIETPVTPKNADFQIGLDKIELQGFEGITAENVMDFVSEDADGNAHFEAQGTSITLFGVSRSDVTASDFTYPTAEVDAASVRTFARSLDDAASVRTFARSLDNVNPQTTVTGVLVTDIPNLPPQPETSVVASFQEGPNVAKVAILDPDAPAPDAKIAPLIAINIGSDTGFTSADGTVFAADTTGVGNRYSSQGTISGTDDDVIYKTEAWSPDGLDYAFDLADGTYDVKLHFAEIWNPAHKDEVRVFDIALEGDVRVDNLDVFAESGGRTAHILDLEVTVTDGELNLSLLNGIQNPKLSALEISRHVDDHDHDHDHDGDELHDHGDDHLHDFYDAAGLTADAPSQAKPVVAINIGADTGFTAADGTVFAADTTGIGNRYSSEGTISGTDDDTIYKTEAWDPNGLDYAFDLADGNYEVRLHFAEIWNPAHRDEVRVFDIAAEDNLIMDDLDIFAESGGRTAHIVDFDVTVTDGELNLSLIKGLQNPKLSAIEIWKDTDDGQDYQRDTIHVTEDILANVIEEEFAI